MNIYIIHTINDTPIYTTEGDVRGCCGHKHRTVQTAAVCLRRDQQGAERQGGYSDRRIVRLTIDEWGVWHTGQLTDREDDEYLSTFKD